VLFTLTTSVLPVHVDAQVDSFTHSTIKINGDSTLNRTNGVVSGSGTGSDPYIIEDWQIGPNSGGSGIAIWNTRAHVIIRTTYVFQCNIGIVLGNVSNVRIDYCAFYQNIVGINVYESDDVKIVDSIFRENNYAISVVNSDVKRFNNDYFDNNQNLLEKKVSWEQGPIGNLVCYSLLVLLAAIVGVLVLFRVRHYSRRPKSR
jgi:hypothetical protein